MLVPRNSAFIQPDLSFAIYPFAQNSSISSFASPSFELPTGLPQSSAVASLFAAPINEEDDEIEEDPEDDEDDPDEEEDEDDYDEDEDEDDYEEDEDEDDEEEEDDMIIEDDEEEDDEDDDIEIEDED